jgi:hypothetical protein
MIAMPTKSSEATVRKRVEEVLALRLLGAEFIDVRRHAAEQKWRVSDRQLWRYIAEGDKVLAATLQKDRDKLVNRHIAQRRALYARAMSVSDYRTALAVLEDEAELLALYPAKRIEAQVEVKHDTPLSIAVASDPEAHELACRLLERVAVSGGPGGAAPRTLP